MSIARVELDDRGHIKGGCKYTDNFGDSCECEPWDLERLAELMTALGWDVDTRMPRGRVYVRHYGRHIITVSKVKSGWMHRWEKSNGHLTITESGSFGTLQYCLNDLWGSIFRMSNHCLELEAKLATASRY